MNQFDWQEFEGGDASPELQRKATEALTNDPAARRELDGLASFRHSIREASLAEPVPTAALEGMLGSVVKSAPRQKPVWFWLAPTAAAATLAAVLVFARINEGPASQPFVSTAAVATHSSSNPRETALWLVSQTNEPLPTISLDGVACHLDGARVGKEWVAWDFEMTGKNYTIYAKRNRNALDRYPTTQKEGRKFWVNQDGVGWYCAGGMSYFVTGGTEEGRWRIAGQACRETPKLVRL